MASEPPPFPAKRLAQVAGLGGALGGGLFVLLFGLPGQTQVWAGSVLFYTFLGGSVTWALAGLLIPPARGLFPEAPSKQLAISFAAGIPIGAGAVVLLYQLLSTVFHWWVARALA
jgi:hypothetical protein